jgi:hypothetical protein
MQRIKQERARSAATRVAFDQETLITTVTVPKFDIQMSSTALATLIDASDPKNWSKYVSDFFRRSEPGSWRDGKWQPLSRVSWPSDGTGQIYEVAAWRWNAMASAEVHNILDIRDFRKESQGIFYRYALSRCVKSKLGLTWQEGGLDLNEGYYQATARRSAKRGMWHVTIAAQKRVRYSIREDDPLAVGTVLNLMAPALVSFLMRALVYDTARAIAGLATSRSVRERMVP